MPDDSQRNQSAPPSAWKERREWLTTIAIIIGVVVGIYEWWLKEVLFPGSAPVNVTTDVTVKQAGSKAALVGKNKSELEAIEVLVAARNPSTREIYLLNNFWAASGMTIEARQQEGAARRRSMLAAVGAIDSSLYRDQQIFSGKHFRLDQFAPVASGMVFPVDSVLRPQESISRRIVFYVPKGAYDAVEVDVALPTSSKQRPAASRLGRLAETLLGLPSEGQGPAAGVDFSLRLDGLGYVYSVHRTKSDDTTEPLARDESGEYSQNDLDELGFAVWISWNTISLWEDGAPSSESAADKISRR
jgi:hypothetical protein